MDCWTEIEKLAEIRQSKKICKSAADERDVREALDSIWENPRNSGEVLSKLAKRNKKLYEFERMLEES